MVAFAGRQFAARSPPVFVADFTHTVNSFTLVRQLDSTYSFNFSSISNERVTPSWGGKR